MEKTAQIIGIIAMVINICSFVQKEQKNIIAMQFVGSILFAINMLMLDAITGGLMNVAGIVRGFIFLNKKRLGKLKWVFTGGLFVLYIALYICGFVVLGKDPSIRNLIVEFLPVFAMIVMTLGYALEGAKKTRVFGFINSPPWLIYNIMNRTIGGIICEVFCISSIILGMILYDRKESNCNGKV